MADHKHDDWTDNPEVAHEDRDINVRAIMWFIGIFLVFAVVSHVGLYFLHEWYAKKSRESEPPPRTLVRQAGPQLPAEPRLQPFPNPQGDGRSGVTNPFNAEPVVSPLESTPVYDMAEMQRQEAERLSKYGWTDQRAGRTHIPIDRAMDAVVSRGFPVRTAPTPTTPAPATAGATASAGGAAPAPNPAPQRP